MKNLIQEVRKLYSRWWEHPDYEEGPLSKSRGSYKGSYWQPKPYKKPKPWISSGGVVIESMMNPTMVYVIKPSRDYGPWSFPKGRVDEGETHKQAAKREVWEETGIRAKFLPQGYLGKGKGTSSITHFYMMVKTGGRPSRTDETDETRLVTFDEARKLFRLSGNRRDVKIADLAEEWLAKRVK